MQRIWVLLLILVCAHTHAATTMQNKHYDVIVVGLGAMGSAAAYQLAKAGVTVLGIDLHSPPHEFGSSYGDTRITRLAIGEGLEYVPLVLRSRQIWQAIEQQTDYELLTECGGLLMSTPTQQEKHGVANFLVHTINAANKFHIKYEDLNAIQIHTKFPQFALVGGEHGYYEPQAGYLRPEKCIEAQLELAKKYGGTLNFDEKVLSFTEYANQVTVKTNKNTYTAAKIILTAGPWIKELLPEYAHIFKIYRQNQYWFALKDPKEYASYNKLPVFIWIYGNKDDDFIYGFPAIDGPNGGLKVATESFVADTTPATVQRDVSPLEIAAMYKKIAHLLPGLSQKCIKAISCMYTVTPDQKFVIDFLPEHTNVIVASPCSGHGFKHSAAIGEILMELATKGHSTLDISAFTFKRFKQ